VRLVDRVCRPVLQCWSLADACLQFRH
jgi:hypothetical protein